MKIICLFAQRKSSYEGQYAAELCCAVDEYTEDYNPAYLEKAELELKNDADISFYKRLTIEVPDEDFDKVFFGEHNLTGTISSVKRGEGE
jgi:hypothetical protein